MSIANGTNYGSQIQIDAIGGAVVDFSGVTQIADGAERRLPLARHGYRDGSGAGSSVKLNALTTFTEA